MYYEFYIDQFFAVHVLTGYLLLDLATAILGVSCSWKRLLAASLVNTAAVILAIIIGIQGIVPAPFWNRVLLWAGSLTGVCGAEKLLFKYRRSSNSKGSSYRKSIILLMTILFAGIQQILADMVNIPDGTGAVIAYVFLKKVIKRRKKHNMGSIEKVQVILYWKEKQQILDGVVDTGNMLREPLTGKAVSIVEKQGIQEMLGTKWQQHRGFFLIPYHSIGKEKGWLQAVTMEKMEIKTDEKCVCVEQPVLAIYEGNLSAQKGYQVILHPQHIK